MWQWLKTEWTQLINWLRGVEFSVAATQLSLYNIISGIFTVVISLYLALWLGRYIERRLEKNTHLEGNTRVALGRFIKALLLVFGLLLALKLAGIDLTLLSIFGGALGVGLGFGLQKIAANYLSGYIVLLDKSIQIGNLITVDKFYGKVTRINTRYTVIKSFDSTEAIVPNEMLITHPVQNHTYTDNQVRVQLKITVGYSTEVAQFKALMLQAAQAHPRVIASPAPLVLLCEFAPDGLQFELQFWIADPQNGQLNVRSDIAEALWAAMQVAGIAVPYPQRVVHLQPPAPNT